MNESNRASSGLVRVDPTLHEYSGHKPRPYTFRLLALLCLFGVLAIAGCIRVEIAISVNDDGSGVIGYTIAISDEFREFSGSMGDDLETLGLPSEDDLEGLPAGSEIQEYLEDGYLGFVVSIPFDDPSHLESVLEDVQGGGGEELLPEVWQDQDGGWRFSMKIPASQEAGLSDTVGMSDEMGFALAETLLGDGWFRVRISLPGDVVEHNADRVEGDTLVWETSLTSTEPRDMMARTTPAGGWPLLAVVIVAVVVMIVVLVTALLVWRATKREAL